jgi:hypothetical protein
MPLAEGSRGYRISMDENRMTKTIVAMPNAYSRCSSRLIHVKAYFARERARTSERASSVFVFVQAMASVLSLPRLPLASPTTAPAASSSRFSTSQPGVCNSRQPIWSTAASERTSLSCTVVDGATSWTEAARNAGLEAQAGASRSSVRCCAGEEQGACSTSGSGSDGAMPGRREVLLSATLGAAVLGVFGSGGEAMARDRRNKKEINPEDYVTSGKIICCLLLGR